MTKNISNKKVYWVLLVLSVIIGSILYGFLEDQFSSQFLVLFSGLPFLLFVTGIFGLLWPKIKPAGNEVYIIHALLIGLFFIHVWLILPLICADFGSCLGV